MQVTSFSTLVLWKLRIGVEDGVGAKLIDNDHAKPHQHLMFQHTYMFVFQLVYAV